MGRQLQVEFSAYGTVGSVVDESTVGGGNPDIVNMLIGRGRYAVVDTPEVSAATVAPAPVPVPEPVEAPAEASPEPPAAEPTPAPEPTPEPAPAEPPSSV